METWSYYVALDQPDFKLLTSADYMHQHQPRFHRDLTIVTVQGDLTVVSVQTCLTIKRGT